MATVLNDIDLYLQASTPRVIATSVTISSSGGAVFKTAKNGGATTPSSTVFTPTVVNFTGASVKTWHYALNTSPTTWVSIGSSATLTVTNTTFLGYISTASAITYRVTVTEAGYTTAYGYFTMSYAKDADDGNYTGVISLYLQAGSVPTQPTSIPYTFSTNTIGAQTGGTAGWSLTQPASSSTPTYVTKCTASTATPASPVTLSSWSTPVVVAQSGSAGSTGIRGPLFVTMVGSWNQTTAEATLASMASGRNPTTPIRGDIVSYTGGALEYNGSSWGAVSTYVDGSIVASGTIAGGRLAADISIVSNGYIQARGNNALSMPILGSVGVVGYFDGLTNSRAVGSYSTGTSVGAFGYSTGTGTGVYGSCTGTGSGVYGNASGAGGTGLTAVSSLGNGVFGSSASVSYAGGYFQNTAGGYALNVSGTAYISGVVSSGSTASLSISGNAASSTQISNSGHGYTFVGGATTGGATGTFIANKPGSTSTVQWLQLNIDGGGYVIPIWTI